MKTNYTVKTKTQSGIALITVMVVLFILTLLGITATDSSNFQALMVRNNQFRLETFNTSRAEIQDQLASYNAAQFNAAGALLGPDGMTVGNSVVAIANTNTSAPLVFAINSNGIVGTRDGSNNGVFDVLFPPEVPDGAQQVMIQNVALQRTDGCDIFGSSLGNIPGSQQCHKIRLDSDAQLSGTSIQSLQSQTIAFLAF